MRPAYLRSIPVLLSLILVIGCEKKNETAALQAQRASQLTAHLVAGNSVEISSAAATAAFKNSYVTSLSSGGHGIRAAVDQPGKNYVSCVDPLKPPFIDLALQFGADLRPLEKGAAPVGFAIVKADAAKMADFQVLQGKAWRAEPVTINFLVLCAPAQPVPPSARPLPLSCAVAMTEDGASHTLPPGGHCSAQALGGAPAGPYPPTGPYPLLPVDGNCRVVGLMWTNVIGAGQPGCSICSIGDCADLSQIVECNCDGVITCSAQLIGTHQGPNGEFCGFGCFAKGTKIQMKDRSEKLAEEIKAGDLLWNPVKKSGVRVKYVANGSDAEGFYELKAGDHTLRVTGIHPLPTQRGMLQAKALIPGDTLFDSENRPLKLDSVRQIKDSGAATFNFDLEASTGEPGGRVLVGNGIATGDLRTQTAIQGEKPPTDSQKVARP